MGRFQAGKALFNRVFTPETGLGPLFNENQCSACHTDPASGGSGDQIVLRAARFSPDGECDLLTESGGENLRLQATATLRSLGISREEVPLEANVVDRVAVPFLFGLGLLEAISDSTLLALADPEDRNGDGISGRVGLTRDGEPARFGFKADHATLDAFTAAAFHQELGVTTPLRPEPERVNGRLLPPGSDPLPEPELDMESLSLTADFVRFLAPLPRRTPSDTQSARLVERGEALFRSLGCASCHVPALETGAHPVAALSRKRVPLYSDLLLHDLGPDVPGVCGPGATPTEVRTTPLWGLGRRRVFLHHGRAFSLSEAVLLHGGEAERARRAFETLTELERVALLRFLESL